MKPHKIETVGVILLIISTGILLWYIPYIDSQINNNQKELNARYGYQTEMHIYQSIKHSTLQHMILIAGTNHNISVDSINTINNEMDNVTKFELDRKYLFEYGGGSYPIHINTIELENIKLMDYKNKLQIFGAIFQIVGFLIITMLDNKHKSDA